MTVKQFQKILKEALEIEDMSTSSLQYIMNILSAAISKYANNQYGIYAHSEEDDSGQHVGYYFYLAHPNPWHDLRFPEKGSLAIKLSKK
jgi:hypothetical protein